MQTRLVEVRRHLLSRNDEAARALRSRFNAAGIFVVSLVSSPGSGKTTLLRRTLQELIAAGHSAAAVVGDLATDNDARVLAGSGAPVRQIVTGTVCHLEAQMIQTALADWRLDELDFLFIENVGNLVCPAGFDLGEHLRVVTFSVTEGEDKPQKYATIFNTADLVIISKLDLAAAVRFDRPAALAAIRSVRPNIEVLELSAVTAYGFQRWIELLRTRCNAGKRKRVHPF